MTSEAVDLSLPTGYSENRYASLMVAWVGFQGIFPKNALFAFFFFFLEMEITQLFTRLRFKKRSKCKIHKIKTSSGLIGMYSMNYA